MSRVSRRMARRVERSALPLLQQPFGEVRSGLRPFEFLTPDQIETIHNASLEILENVGIDFLDDEALAIWRAAGAKVDTAERHVWIDRGLLLEQIAKAPPSFTWRARNPGRNLFIGQNSLVFGPNGGMVYAQDLDNGRRVGTMADYQNFIKLSHMAPQLHLAAWEQVAPQDIPANIRHLHRLMAAITLSDKALMEAAHGRVITADCLEMARILFGRLEGDPVIGDVINVNSPLRYDERMLGGLITYARAGQVTFITPFILAGAMSPVTMAAALAQQNAEALAGVALTQLVRPGAPVIYGGFTTNIDLKSGSPAFGTPEGAWALLVGGQLARFYNLPYRGSGSLTNAKTADAQASYETMWNLWPAVLAHTNLIMHAVGWLEGGLTASFEKFVIDLENLAMFRHFLEGFAVDASTLALDMIAEVGAGGHHLGTSHTQERYRTAFYQSSLADRQNYDSWAEGGGAETAVRANKIWKEMLEQYERPTLDVAIEEALAEFVSRREKELEGKSLYE
ncbi:MAG: trimethylamine methyltransferase family protein [Candidatus Promineifilaceae bacterium]